MRILVLGAAVSGLAAARLATSQGHSVVVYDAKPERASEIISGGLSAVVGAWDPDHLTGVDLVVASPGFPERSAPITDSYEAGVDVVAEFEWAWDQLAVDRTVAVTGTNGKTTVTALTAEMLSASGVGASAMGNIGVAVSEAVLDPPSVAVIEVSSAQLQMSRTFHPDIAVVTNVEADHLDWHGSAEAYRRAKEMIVARQGPTDVVVFSSSDSGATAVASSGVARLLGVDQFSMADHGFGGDLDSISIAGERILRSELAVPPGPFVQNILLASAAALEAGARIEPVLDRARSFTPSAHRQRTIATIGGVEYVDDSKATNPHAALAAISAYESVVLIAGGQSKGLDIASLARHPNVKAVIAMGESAPLLCAAAPGISQEVVSMSEAVEVASGLAVAGDVVLLSPGGASWDMFDSYAHRGDAFAAAVNEIVERSTA
ncbi:MAG TPA: UDP-N-acetylmuramoyl-L-alanine--D-glutamate ligase [Acidimicrobiia bacterium]